MVGSAPSQFTKVALYGLSLLDIPVPLLSRSVWLRCDLCSVLAVLAVDTVISKARFTRALPPPLHPLPSPVLTRLLGVLLRVCLASAEGPLLDTPVAAAVEGERSGAVSEAVVYNHYLPRLYDCLRVCPDLLPYAAERGLMELLLRLPAAPVVAPLAQSAPGPPGTSPVIMLPEAAHMTAMAAAARGLRLLCAEWLGQPVVAGERRVAGGAGYSGVGMQR